MLASGENPVPTPHAGAARLTSIPVTSYTFFLCTQNLTALAHPEFQWRLTRLVPRWGGLIAVIRKLVFPGSPVIGLDKGR